MILASDRGVHFAVESHVTCCRVRSMRFASICSILSEVTVFCWVGGQAPWVHPHKFGGATPVMSTPNAQSVVSLGWGPQVDAQLCRKPGPTPHQRIRRKMYSAGSALRLISFSCSDSLPSKAWRLQGVLTLGGSQEALSKRSSTTLQLVLYPYAHAKATACIPCAIGEGAR